MMTIIIMIIMIIIVIAMFIILSIHTSTRSSMTRYGSVKSQATDCEGLPGVRVRKFSEIALGPFSSLVSNPPLIYSLFSFVFYFR